MPFLPIRASRQGWQRVGEDKATDFGPGGSWILKIRTALEQSHQEPSYANRQSKKRRQITASPFLLLPNKFRGIYNLLKL